MKGLFRISINQFLTIVLLFVSSMLLAQGQISGTVVDSNTREPIIGASVIIKGNPVGTVTDASGQFTLKSVSAKTKLVISYLGYNPQEITVGGKTQVVVSLEENSKQLQDLVVVGYGVQRKSDLTGAVSSVKMTEVIKSTPVANITDALQGRLSGVSIVSASGQPGSGSTIRVRGMNSLNADGGPLVVVDGIIGGSLGSLNPSDIQSVEVLKDASATAVYGSRGANGVILVTTKTPEVGKVTFNYNGYVNIKTPYSTPAVMSPYEFAELANAYASEMNASDAANNLSPYYTEAQIAAFKAGEGGYNYMDNIFRKNSIEQTHEASIQGGAGKTKFILSGNYNRNEGVVYNSRAEKVNYRLKLDSELRDWFRLGANIWGDYGKSYGPRFSQYNNTLIGALTFPTTIQPKDDNGIYNNKNLTGPQWNPMIFINEFTPNDGYSYTSRLQGYAEIEPIKGLTLRSTNAFSFYYSDSRNVYGVNSYEYFQNNGSKTSASAYLGDSFSWTNTNVLSYVKEFNKNHRVNATGVFEQSIGDSFSVTSTGIDLPSVAVGANNTALAVTVSGSSSASRTTMMSYLARLNYVFMNRYMLTGSLRYDGSSRLAYENRWAQFPSAALAWNIKEEPFLRDVSWLDQAKVRFGYGVTGNQAVAAYSAFTTVTASRDASNNLTIAINTLGNKNLKWELTRQKNLGLDLGFFNNRLTFTMDVYDKQSTDVLLTVDAPAYTGFPSRLANAAAISNKGLEITLGADPYVNKDLNWNTTVILSKNVGRIEELAEGKNYQEMTGNYETTFYRNIKGEKIASMWGYKCLGVWTTQEINEMKSSMTPAEFAKYGIEAGSWKYEDLDGKPGITADDRQVIGNGQPTFQWSWNNTLRYKDFDFSLFVIGIHGFDIFNYTRSASIGLAPNYELKNRWIAGVNENTNIAGFVSKRLALTPSSLFVEKGDFVKVKSITLGYTLPATLSKKATISSLRVYASLQNPFLFTDYSGLDPEVTLKTPITSGVDYGYYPNGRNYVLGLNFQF